MWGKCQKLEKIFRSNIDKRHQRGYPTFSIYRDDDKLPHLPNIGLYYDNETERFGHFNDMSACRIFYAAKQKDDHYTSQRYWTPSSLTNEVIDLYMTKYYIDKSNSGQGKTIESAEDAAYKRQLFQKYMSQFPTYILFDQ